jgi:tetratricopeptide (TPR) repeat protein
MIVADHGEGLWRHQEATHATLVYDTTLRVPMLLRLPAAERAGERSSALVSVVDVFPTLLAGMQLDVPIGDIGDIDGRDLRAPLAPDRGLYFESFYGYLNYGWSPLSGWVDSSGKYIHSASPEFYEPASDAAEEINLYAPEDPRSVRARAAIEQLLRKPALSISTDNLGAQPDITALGYAGAASASVEIPHPLAATELPAPGERRDELSRMNRALSLVDEGKRDEAITELERITAENPRNARAHQSLGRLLIEADRPREALKPLRAILNQGYDHPNVRRGLVLAHGALREYRKARRHAVWLEQRGFPSPLQFPNEGRAAAGDDSPWNTPWRLSQG